MNINILNAFKILELKENATLEDIKKAYRLKAKQYHPDFYFEKQDKKNAETQFKLIKEAYDYLVAIEINRQHENTSNEEFSSFFTENIVDDELNDFYYQEDEAKKFADIQKKAINTIEKEIKKRNIHQLNVFENIRQNKLILYWKPGQVNSDVLYDYLIKENLYRGYVRSTDLYQGYLKQSNFFEHLDTYATLIINPKLYHKKKFEERIYYCIDTICNECKGLGCEYCNYAGIIEQEHNLNIKVPFNNPSKFYEINNGGKHSEIINGKLILAVKIDYHLKQPYKINFKNDRYEKYVPLIDFFINLKKWILSHKQLTILYSTILVLIIIIICLAVLL